MNMLFLLLVLTKNAAGDINAAFVNADNPAACVLKQEQLKGIFLGAGIPIVYSGCDSSRIIFPEYKHATSSLQKRYFYQITLNNKGFSIQSIKDWQECKSSPPGVICASSVQSPISQP